jgi:copper transport protein
MRGIGFACVLFAALAQTGAALAHASLVHSEPADRAVVARAPATITLVFNEPVSPVVLRLVAPNGDSRELNDVVAENATLIINPPHALTPGTHLLSWRVISADGHPVGGALTFSVSAPSRQAAAPGAATDRPLGWTIWTVKFLLYAGLFVGVGGAFYRGWIAAHPLLPGMGGLVVAALLAAIAAAVVSVALQGADALGLGLPALAEPRVWRTGLASPYGPTAIIAVGAAMVGLLAMQSGTERGRWLSFLALIGVGACFAASGHASSTEPRTLTRTAVFLHGIAVAFWVGALGPLAAAMGNPKQYRLELQRFSRAIPIPLTLLIASGIVLAVLELQRVDALWTTAYGLVLSGKLAAVLVLLALAAVNRYALTPRATAGDGVAIRRLAGSSLTELLLALVIFGLVATWRFTAPPRAVWAAAQVGVHGHIHTEKAMADLDIEPASAGEWSIRVTVLDGQFGPLPAKEVTLFLASVAASVEPLRLPATHVEGAIWRTDHVLIPAVGRWQVRVEILVNDFEKVSIEDEIELPNNLR